MSIEIVELGPEHGSAAAVLAGVGDGDERLSAVHGVAAIEAGAVVGFLAAYAPIPRFRRTERTGAHVPEWGHGVRHADPALVYRAMYGATAKRWAALGCAVHTITILDDDRTALDSWFEMGFGMLLVDAVIDADAVLGPAPTGGMVRRATPDDAEVLATLDTEHVTHYAEPPTSMAPPAAWTTDEWRAFLEGGRYGAWIAELEGDAAGFIRFVDEHGGSDVTADPDGAFVDGLFVRPQCRGLGMARALVRGGTAALADAGVHHVALDYESINPTAAGFWPTCSTAVARSLMRIPEA